MRLLPNTFILVIVVSLFLTFSIVVSGSDSSDWSYDGETGPDHWDGYCKEKSQSPIDIEDKKTKTMHEMPFKFVNYDKNPEEDVIKNVGSTIKVYTKLKEGEKPATVTGGGLPGTYAFAQLHFHWGESDTTGSEHTIDKTAYPVEMHLVHFNLKYGEDLASAISNGGGAQDTLAVLGVLFKVQSKNNEKIEPIIKGIDEIMTPSSHSHTKLFALQDLLPESTKSFYRYNGSLTTPACNEIVIWTVFKDPAPISSSQLTKLRSLGEGSPNMKHNFRPVQPLNGRTVFTVDTSAAPAREAAGLGVAVLSLAVTMASRAMWQ